MSAEMDALTAEWNSFKADVTAQGQSLLAKVKALTDQVTNAPNDTAAIDALKADIATSHAAFDALVNPQPSTANTAATGGTTASTGDATAQASN